MKWILGNEANVCIAELAPKCLPVVLYVCEGKGMTCDSYSEHRDNAYR